MNLTTSLMNESMWLGPVPQTNLCNNDYMYKFGQCNLQNGGIFYTNLTIKYKHELINTALMDLKFEGLMTGFELK